MDINDLYKPKKIIPKQKKIQTDNDIFDFKRFKRIIIISSIIFIILSVLLLSVYKIDAGERGVLLTFGKANSNEMNEGIHFKIPFAQTVEIFEVRTQKIETTADSASKDLQDVQTVTALNYHIDPENTVLLYTKIGKDYTKRIIDPAIQETVRSVSARFNANELVTRRSEVRMEMAKALSERLSKYYIVVDDFNIVNFQFSAAFDEAIEAKVTAEQLKLKADMDLERIKVEAEQTIAAARAEAEALKLQKEQITPDLIKLREIEARIAAIEKWNGIMPTVTGGVVPFIEVGSV